MSYDLSSVYERNGYRTGEWLGYPKAVEQMRKEGYVV